VYFLYTVDPDSGTDAGPYGFGRLTRYTVAPGETPVVDPASRTVLMGEDWTNGPLSAGRSHTVGHLRFGADGSLLVSIGDGARYFGPDSGGRDPAAFGPGRTDPNEDVGAVRAQDISSLCGKLLRINPATGHGYAGNPYANGDLASVESRVWAYGFRNPFRFELRPGTGSADTAVADPGVLYVGEVGWESYEEIDLVKPAGANFGWPCREGPAVQSAYAALQPAHSGCGTVGITATNPAAATDPFLWWHHETAASSFPPGWVGQTAIAGAFYTGTLYPPGYHGRFFYADFVRSYVRALEVDPTDAFVSASLFADLVEGPVCVARDPSNGDLLYIAIVAQEVRRFRYTGAAGGNTPPVAVAAADAESVAVAEPVTFTGAGSFDPDAGPLDYQWQFGDGTGSTLADPARAFGAPGAYSAVLTVRDAAGALGLDTVTVHVSEPVVGTGDAVPASVALGPARPNPTGTAVGFALELPAPARVEWAVLDVQGREVWRDDPGVLQAGRHMLTWSAALRSGGRAAPGLYLMRVRAGGVERARRFVVLR
jgi:glucose/arabinose dehydrogenase